MDVIFGGTLSALFVPLLKGVPVSIRPPSGRAVEVYKILHASFYSTSSEQILDPTIYRIGFSLFYSFHLVISSWMQLV
jgi:hypothetical protein